MMTSVQLKNATFSQILVDRGYVLITETGVWQGWYLDPATDYHWTTVKRHLVCRIHHSSGLSFREIYAIINKHVPTQACYCFEEII